MRRLPVAAVVDGDPRTLVRERQRDLPPDPARGARHQHHLTRELYLYPQVFRRPRLYRPESPACVRRVSIEGSRAPVNGIVCRGFVETRWRWTIYAPKRILIQYHKMLWATPPSGIGGDRVQAPLGRLLMQDLGYELRRRGARSTSVNRVRGSVNRRIAYVSTNYEEAR